MITLKQYNFCRKIGLPPIPHVERYFAIAGMTNAGLAVTGAGALGGALISQLKYNRDKKKLQREGKDTSHLSRAKYAVAGAALGGAAGFGTQHALKADISKDQMVKDFKTGENWETLKNNKNAVVVGVKDNSGFHYGIYDKEKETFKPIKSNIFGIRGKGAKEINEMYGDSKVREFR